MQVIGGKERPEPLLEPGIDFIMERAIDQDAGERVIDTGYTFVPAVLTRLNGRKYVGENTVRDMGRLIGLVDGDEARRIQADFDLYKQTARRIFDELRAVGVNITRLIDNPLSDGMVTQVPQVPADRQAQIEHAEYLVAVEAAQAKAAEAVNNEGGAPAANNEEEDDVGVKHLTGSERVALERQVGKLQEVGDRGDLVYVPDDLEKAAEGVEEISGQEVAKATYTRGIGHAEQAQEQLEAADAASHDGSAEADVPGVDEDKDADESDQ